MDLWKQEKNTLKWDNEKKEYFEGNLKKLVENEVKKLDLASKVFNNFLLLFLEISFSLSFFKEFPFFEFSLFKKTFHFKKERKSGKAERNSCGISFKNLTFRFFFLREFSL